MRTYFMTGFPGFLATKLIEQLARVPDQIACFHLLHLSSERNTAAERRQDLLERTSLRPDQLVLHEGDITVEQLALSSETRMILQQDVTHIFHLAALYDLATAYEPAFR
ncbi:MAG: SDR family oxidoreductase, partial [Exiguobacterium acetylicum]